ncbi:SDR family NAD(P)-dependent oxidoreductase [Nonomuraea sp. NPDC050536]|uniref:SDR family NAD(P)-dependent oxidoreductase n=1 Tax=Nonomuraea sp. NPDC050536 TaxID=3364366 RepID=UPI0037CAFA9D
MSATAATADAVAADDGLAGRVAMVTGAAGGIGAAVAAALADAGAKTCVLDVREDALRAVAGQIPGAQPYPVDVIDVAGMAAAVAAIEREVGPIGLVVSAAGVLHPGALADTTADDWWQMQEVNAYGVFNVIKAVAPAMMARGGGAIITIASNAARVPRAGMAGYAASKAAAMQLTLSAGLELAPYGIRCNVIAPGSTDTPMLAALGGDPVAGDPDRYRLGIPTGRITRPDEIAQAVLFVARCPQIAQVTLTIDGGASLSA